jgi:hypothetical protein
LQYKRDKGIWLSIFAGLIAPLPNIHTQDFVLTLAKILCSPCLHESTWNGKSKIKKNFQHNY